MRSQDAWACAAQCAARIKTTVDSAEREFLLHMRDYWIETANKLATIEDDVAATAKEQ